MGNNLHCEYKNFIYIFFVNSIQPVFTCTCSIKLITIYANELFNKNIQVIYAKGHCFCV